MGGRRNDGRVSKSEGLGAASEWNWVRKLPQQEAGALGKGYVLPGVKFWTMSTWFIFGGSSKVWGQGLCVLMDLVQFAVTQSYNKTHYQHPCSPTISTPAVPPWAPLQPCQGHRGWLERQGYLSCVLFSQCSGVLTHKQLVGEILSHYYPKCKGPLWDHTGV